jgi:DNA-binding CsgD family transcriptional regulator
VAFRLRLCRSLFLREAERIAHRILEVFSCFQLFVVLAFLCSVLDCIGKGSEIPNFDMDVNTRSGERLWVNISTVIFHNQRTREKMLVHLAHDITEQRKQDGVFRQVLTLSKEISSLGERIGRTAPVSPLSAQEIEVLKMFAGGNSPSKIAKKLGISSQTLRNHLHHINQKLRTHNRLEAVMHAMQRKLI